MKYIIFFFLISTAAIVVPNILKPTKQDSVVAKADTTKLSPDSVSWFERNLDLYIQSDYFTFDPVYYTQGLTPEAKAELSLECWLGTFTISDMFKEKNCLKVDFSNEQVTKIMYITKTYFVLTMYSKNESIKSSGSSLLYNPKTNELKKLDSIIVFGVNNNNLECSKESFSEVDGYVIEHGHYNIDEDEFIFEFKD